jgi:hypothetical protein
MRGTYALLLIYAFFSAGCTRVADPLPGFPKLVLWAWERPENLSYIVPRATGVAYLADTIELEPEGMKRHPRAQPLWVPKDTPLVAVMRVESHSNTRPDVTAVAGEIVRAVNDRPIRAVQVDFDARNSERSYYRDLLRELRARLAASVQLQMTALVSWCESDDWIRALPVTDAVPMFFRMGVDPHSTSERLREPLCASSFGISTDEFYVQVPRGRRVYVFTNRPWTETSYRAVLQASKGWS